MANPIPLTDPDGRLYAYACGVCHNVHAGEEWYGEGRDWPDEAVLEHRKEMTDKCCRCQRCGAVEPTRALCWSVCKACRPAHDREQQLRMEENENRNRFQAAMVAGSVTNSIDPGAAWVLQGCMSELSEDEWCASWLIGLEYILWARVCNGDHPELLKLAEQAGGWWKSNEMAMDCVFVKMDAWLRDYEIYETWDRLSREQWKAENDSSSGTDSGSDPGDAAEDEH
jgi:hypothetical protein